MLLWYRRDLRLSDHSALDAARRTGAPVIPVFIWAPEEEGTWPPGAASRWWLHQSLEKLSAALERRGSRLILRSGPVVDTLAALLRETGATRIRFSRRYEPAARIQEERLLTAFPSESPVAAAEGHNASLLFEPWEIASRDGRPFQVFTPFWKSCLSRPALADPLPAPRTLKGPARWPRSLSPGELDLEPSIDWTAGMRSAWQPGEEGAKRALARFLDTAVRTYPDDRNRPDLRGTSRLSPHLHFGEISPRQVWHESRGRAATDARGGVVAGVEDFLREVGWREFAHHLLWHFPQTPDEPLRAEFARFPWSRDPKALRAWQRGRTGYPVVDAGMRELWATGWMHNRVRMVAASFLVKDLLIPWQDGARWFWDTLVDADLADNTLGWQWTAGCGADAAPYFRIFNPTLQGEKFDPQGAYVRRWVPEIAGLSEETIHRPPQAPAGLFPPEADAAGRGGRGHRYSVPIVDHAAARERALAAYRSISLKR